MAEPPLRRRLLAEFLGSAFLAAVVIGSGIAAASVGWQHEPRPVRERRRHGRPGCSRSS